MDVVGRVTQVVNFDALSMNEQYHFICQGLETITLTIMRTKDDNGLRVYEFEKFKKLKPLKKRKD